MYIPLLMTILLSTFSEQSNHLNTQNQKIDNAIFSNDRYRVTAETRNPYGKNYWVDLIVEAYVSSGYSSISSVKYDDGNGLKTLSYSKEYGYDNTYSVYIDYQKYYFKF